MRSVKYNMYDYVPKRKYRTEPDYRIKRIVLDNLEYFLGRMPHLFEII